MRLVEIAYGLVYAGEGICLVPRKACSAILGDIETDIRRTEFG